ncbi:MAG: hypothetical protein GY862_29835 [Gammaproteobacteria bacterium]|nr:hypothetical protein [Gammaproteobacteria bacterium]
MKAAKLFMFSCMMKKTGMGIWLGICLLLWAGPIYAAPAILLSPAVLQGGEEIALNVEGGVPPFLWITQAGQITVQDSDSGKALLTAPQTAGTFIVRLIDSAGEQASATFTVHWQDCSVTPPYVYLEPGQSVNFALHGVIDREKTEIIPDAGWEWLPPDQGFAIRYTAPDAAGFYTLTFIQDDGACGIRSAHVNVYEPFEPVASTVFLETYETAFLEVRGGVPPYLWIEGGKGSLDAQQGKTVRYTPGTITGSETLHVYDSTGRRVAIEVTVASLFWLSPFIQSICQGDTVLFKAAGGQPPYDIIPPSQSGWTEIEKSEDSLTLRFDEIGKYQAVASDQSAQESRISDVNVEICSGALMIATGATSGVCPLQGSAFAAEPIENILRVRVRKDGVRPAVTPLVCDAAGSVDWVCQGMCGTEDFSTARGEQVTFFPPGEGHYTLSAMDQAGHTGEITVSVFRDLCPLYAGADEYLEDREMQDALDDFFSSVREYSRADFYRLTECFPNAG